MNSGDKTLTVILIPALEDNYIYVIRNLAENRNYVIDPSEAQPVLQLFEQQGWTASGVLLTHHHWDHVEGAQEIRDKFDCPIFGHEKDLYRIPQITNPLKTKEFEKNHLSLPGFELEYFFTPGHTLGHICYYVPSLKSLFTGDTFFSYGCGRLFEGTAEQMLGSLKRIAQYPADTSVYCGHEYTLKNLEFALQLEPKNEQLRLKYAEAQKTRAENRSTLPVNLAEQKQLSPFLRGTDPEFQRAVKMENASELAVFTKLRALRNSF